MLLAVSLIFAAFLMALVAVAGDGPPTVRGASGARRLARLRRIGG